MPKILILFALSIFSSVSYGQDSLLNKSDYTHMPKRAAIWSAVIPGAGQIYNERGYWIIPQKKHRAWWKVPIIYGGLGACGYFFFQNNKQASLLKQEFLFRDAQPDPEAPGLFFDERFSEYEGTQSLITGQNQDLEGFDFFSQRRDYFIIGFLGVWGLNVIEAYVDAHFVTFDVNENLSFNWQPTLLQNRTPGIQLQLNFN